MTYKTLNERCIKAEFFFFLFLRKNIFWGYSIEAPRILLHVGAFNEYPQHIITVVLKILCGVLLISIHNIYVVQVLLMRTHNIFLCRNEEKVNIFG